MGYRSQVHFTVVGKHDEMIAGIIAFRLTEPNAAKALGNCCLLKDGEDTILKFYGDNWKWYVDFDDVVELTRLFDYFRNAEDEGEEDRFNGAFVRTGENDEDTKTQYFGSDPYGLQSVERIVHSMYDFDDKFLIGARP